MLPRLETGDRLDADEFMRRYEARPDLKAELIGGVVYVSSPVRIEHGQADGVLQGWAAYYAARHPGVGHLVNATLRLPGGHIVQPDGMLYTEAAARPGPDGYLSGVPELVFEVAVSSEDYDLFTKSQVYHAAGVREYLVWAVRQQRIYWFRLGADGFYALVEPDEDGVIASEVFPGLRLPVARLLAGDFAAVIG